jgi:hypothetical protein
MRRVILAALAIGAVAAGCRNRHQDGLPPASEWHASSMMPPSETPSGKRRFHPGGPDDPHAGLDMSGDPHAGLDMSGAGDPHAGLDMSSAGDPHAGLDMSGAGDPHAGMDMSGNPHAAGGIDVTRLGLEAPDPDRKIDPTQRVAGTITVDARARDRARPGTSVFVVVKRAGADGAPTGSALAVDKLTWSKDGMPFELTDANAMVAGTQLAGDVVVTARYDQDSDALTREPGDITGQIRVKIPADNIKLRLDTVLP